ncbi:hypothetical protein [Dactylosporangium sp. CA-139066]|uniref:hypothetical protein n=1 Tax=Dactylosporangium sp. CA-139066 TaxID=3239930 RepID=UPI003D8AEE1C
MNALTTFDPRPAVPPAVGRVNGHIPAVLAADEPRSANTAAAAELDADLAKTVKRTSYMRQLFYVVVLLVALAGQVSGAVAALGIPLIWAIPAVGALELGGIVVLANADVRRRLGEKANASRILSAAIAAFAVAFNWMAHDNKLLAGFFAAMSALGYLVWLMHTENQRRDRLRAKGQLPPVTPAYELIGHWLRHPWQTLRAKNLAKANPDLGLYPSIAAAQAEKRREVRTAAIAKVLHRKIRAAVDPTTADIAVAVYDLDEIAVRLADGADYDGLTALIGAALTPDRLAAEQPPRKVQADVGTPLRDVLAIDGQIDSAIDSGADTDIANLSAPEPTAPSTARRLAHRQAHRQNRRQVRTATRRQVSAVDTDSGTDTDIDSQTDRKTDSGTDSSTANNTDSGTDRKPARKTATGTARRGGKAKHSPSAIANAAALRERYGNRLPAADNTIRTDMKWSHDRVRAARTAHHAKADINTDSTGA